MKHFSKIVESIRLDFNQTLVSRHTVVSQVLDFVQIITDTFKVKPVHINPLKRQVDCIRAVVFLLEKWWELTRFNKFFTAGFD